MSLACHATNHAQSTILTSFAENPLGIRTRPLEATGMETGITHHADTDVHSLLRKGIANRFMGQHPYYTGGRMYAVRLHRGKWELGYACGQANLFQGNKGAAQLFLEAEQGEK